MTPVKPVLAALLATLVLLPAAAPAAPPEDHGLDGDASPGPAPPRAYPAGDAFWRVDLATGLAHRTPTLREFAENGWPESARLVQQPPRVPGAPLVVAVPAPTGLRLVPLALDGPLDATFVALTPTGARTDTVLQHLGPGAIAWTDARGGFVAKVSGIDLVGREPTWVLDATLDAPLALAFDHDPIRVPLECLSLAPPCDRDAVRYNLGIVGEAKWCARNPTNWRVHAAAVGADIRAGFDTPGHQTLAEPYLSASLCWEGLTLEEAQACDAGAPCADSAGHEYPFPCNVDITCYMQQAWPGIAHGREHASFPPLSLAHVLHDGKWPTGSCGQALLGTLGGQVGRPYEAGSVAIGYPYRVLPEERPCLDHVSTHEIGHSFSAEHNAVVRVTVDGQECWTVMGTSDLGGCRHNLFWQTEIDRVNRCVALAHCPRTGYG